MRIFKGCVRLGNPDLDFENLNPDFPIERKIRKQISPPRNPSSRWFQIKKSKSGFFGFTFLSFDWEIRERICKTILVNSGVLFTNYACACKTAVPKDSFSNPFRTVKRKIQKQIFQRWNPFSGFAFDCKSEIRILKSKSRFPNRMHPKN